MTKILLFLKREPVLFLSLLAAAVSCIFVPPDPGYIDYIDFRTLALLYALMTVVTGLRNAGVFTALDHIICAHAKSTRSIGMILVCLCFFSSILITNDVALLTFVPFAVTVLGKRSALIRVVVLQTVAANLGSILTPVGNPQNLFLFSFYDMSMRDFLSVTFPVWVASLVLVLACCLFLPNTQFSMRAGEKNALDKAHLWLYLTLFFLCLLTVIRLLEWPLMLLILVAALLLLDGKILLKADFMLLLTFVAFFIFSGNLARIDAVYVLLQKLLAGREYLTSLLASQVISNVPAALLLAGFTENAKDLLLGVDIGGLGTPIASLASLIGLKFYSRSEGANLGKFLLEFTALNVLLLVVLSAFQLLL